MFVKWENEKIGINTVFFLCEKVQCDTEVMDVSSDTNLFCIWFLEVKTCITSNAFIQGHVTSMLFYFIVTYY